MTNRPKGGRKDEKYEIMYIIRPSLGTRKIKETISYFNDVLTSNNANILELKEWVYRDLAYEIDKFHKGYYVWLLVEGHWCVSEFNRLVRINETLFVTS